MIKSNLQKVIFVFAFMVSAIFTFGQDKTLTGKVTAFDSIPLSGVDILVKSTGQKLQSDSLGRFQLFCNEKDKIKINANGFFPKTVRLFHYNP